MIMIYLDNDQHCLYVVHINIEILDAHANHTFDLVNIPRSFHFDDISEAAVLVF